MGVLCSIKFPILSLDHCYAIRKLFGSDHDATKSAECGIEDLEYNDGEYMEGHVDEIFEYMCGTADGAREAMSIMDNHPQWEDYYTKVYNDFDMLEEAIVSMHNFDYEEDEDYYNGCIREKRLAVIYEIAKRIDKEDVGNALEKALLYLPNEKELHELINEKLDAD